MMLSAEAQVVPSTPADRRRVAWAGVVLCGLVLAVLAAWAQASGLGRAAVGTEVPHDGGRFVVTGAWNTVDPMMLMHPDDADSFSALGMQMGAMSAMLPDAIPDGSKRVAVELEIAAGGEQMSFPASATTLTVGSDVYPPYLALLGDESLSPGTRVNGVVIFEVPMRTGAAQFRLAPDGEAVHLDFGGGGDDDGDDWRRSHHHST